MNRAMVSIPLNIHEYLSSREGVIKLNDILSDAFCSYYNVWAEMHEPKFDMCSVTTLQRSVWEMIFKGIYGAGEASVFDATDLLDFLVHLDDTPVGDTIELTQQVFDALLSTGLQPDYTIEVCELRRAIIKIFNESILFAQK